MTRTLLPGLLLLLLVPTLSVAQIFKSTDAQGNVTYSDTPQQGSTSEQVKLPQTNTLAAPQSPKATKKPSTSAEPNMEAVTYKVAVTSPANETTFPMGPGNFSVTASVQPPLGDDEQLQLFIDGTPSGAPQAANSWALTNVFRGAHDLTVAVVAKGKALATSDPVRVYVLRPSINFRK